MKEKKSIILSPLMGIMIIILVFCPISQVTATEIWSENFNTLGEWELRGADWPFPLDWNPDFAPTIENGVLQMPNTQTDLHVSQAIHSSTVAYGNWSFDWYVTPGAEHEAYDIVNFIVNNFINESGEQRMEMTGYLLALTSNEKVGSNLNAHAVTLAEWINISNLWMVLKEYQFPSALEGSYHIDITRDITGEFSIYFNKELVLQETDNTTTTSEHFVFGSWYGDTVYDNLTVSDTVEPPPKATAYLHPIMVVIIAGVVIIRRRRHR
ncbi:MAG: hypothetical protein ACXAEU_07170 [Candidatus Hodarchaeales archaeon]|jgi:hypothetical protein